jgi:hypothetical protein
MYRSRYRGWFCQAHDWALVVAAWEASPLLHHPDEYIIDARDDRCRDKVVIRS